MVSYFCFTSVFSLWRSQILHFPIQSATLQLFDCRQPLIWQKSKFPMSSSCPLIVVDWALRCSLSKYWNGPVGPTPGDCRRPEGSAGNLLKKKKKRFKVVRPAGAAAIRRRRGLGDFSSLLMYLLLWWGMKGCHEVQVYRAPSNDRLNYPLQHFLFRVFLYAYSSFSFNFFTVWIFNWNSHSICDKRKRSTLAYIHWQDIVTWIKCLHHAAKPVEIVCGGGGVLTHIFAVLFKTLLMKEQRKTKTKKCLHLSCSFSFSSKLTRPDSHLRALWALGGRKSRLCLSLVWGRSG